MWMYYANVYLKSMLNNICMMMRISPIQQKRIGTEELRSDIEEAISYSTCPN